MNTQAIICTEDHKVSLENVTLGQIQDSDILVKNLYSGISLGTEMLLINNNISWGPYPICIGYQAIGIVEEVGGKVSAFKQGDKLYHRGHQREIIWNGKEVSRTAAAHIGYAVVDTSTKEQGAVDADHAVALLPEEMKNEEAASLFVMPAVGLNGVDKAGVQMGDTVAVLGAGAIGLGAVASAKLRGAVTVAIDLDESRLEVAKKLGADFTINPNNGDTLEQLGKIFPNGADVVFEASGSPKLVNTAITLCRKNGKFVFQGNYGENLLPFDFFAAHKKHLSAYFPCDDGLQPCRQAVLDLMDSGALKWEETITHRLGSEEAPGFYNDFRDGNIKALGAVIKW